MRDPTAPWRGYLELRKHDYVNIGFLEENIELENIVKVRRRANKEFGIFVDIYQRIIVTKLAHIIVVLDLHCIADILRIALFS